MNYSIELLGYIALTAGLFAITKKDMGKFRLWHFISNLFYVVYGAMLNSGPLVISGVTFCIIHFYYLRKMHLNKRHSMRKG